MSYSSQTQGVYSRFKVVDLVLLIPFGFSALGETALRGVVTGSVWMWGLADESAP